mmetsp:Transcript_11934/g.16173  ORF Transcript_11934/g.16173 Transcript_11934/m.16173 type:complete len:421 (-) Transcript_11934:44-1306(-)|eukprot:CAMPEP_0196581586 /NCGR_PEP_ID=MMETSP1081-20130531/34472_1 /TAXON_ID=36882 /ORGANISM="Pyramimonas amylifera, Strain CCMP720" /LENGTH=420 /DNA_ID=CAMNT_0041901875 /DNA_START=77 /DNA_END=1339 /DNA_ORIENTATION=-
MNRVNVLAGHLAPSPETATVAVHPTSSTHTSDDDIVICSAVRTAICKAKRGMFKDTAPDVILSAVMKASVEKAKVNPNAFGDIVIGNCLLQQGPIYMRQAQALAGIPMEVPLYGVNRQCSSGLQAVATVANAIRAGQYEVGMAGGVESMSLADMKTSVRPDLMSPAALSHPVSRACLMPMGVTSENVAKKYGISRNTQDTLAAESHAKASRAQEMGLFVDEIVPVKTVVKDAEGKEVVVTVTKDEGMRNDTTVESLGKLKASFAKDGSTTAGNASQVSDGAACVVLATRRYATAHGLPVLAIFRSYAVAGVPPEIMGIGPAFAIPKALKQAGLSVADIDIYEINEAFASQASYCINKLGIPMSKVNPKGGAIALGHPLGATGARQIATLIPELKRTGGKLGVISMCIGTGMGAAAVIEIV